MKPSLGVFIADRRKQKGMTQAQLAEQMGVTDKAVSKWERDLSCPDINSIPRLAEVLEVTVDQLMQGQMQEPSRRENLQQTLDLAFRAVALAMGTAVAVLSAIHKVDVRSAMTMLGIGLACAAICLMRDQK